MHMQRELHYGTVGEPKLVQASICIQNADVERIKDVKLGGGGLLDLGIYVVQIACFVYNEMPESITAVGNLRGGL